MDMYKATIPIGEEKLAMVRYLNVLNSFAFRGNIIYGKNSYEPEVLFEIIAPDGNACGVYQVPKADKSKPFASSRNDAVFFYGEHRFFFEVDGLELMRLRDIGYESHILEHDRVFGEFMEFVTDYYLEIVNDEL